MNECQCGRGPIVAVLAIFGPDGDWLGPEVCEPCETEYFDRIEQAHR